MIYKTYYCKNCKKNMKCEQRINYHIPSKLFCLFVILITFPFIGWFVLGLLLFGLFDVSPDKKDIEYYCCKCGNKV